MSRRRGDCPFGKYECLDKSCVPWRTGFKCAEDDCPSARDKLCDSGNQCYFSSEACDGDNDCEDGSDEYGCPSKKMASGSNAGIVAIGPVILVAVIIFIIVLVVCLVRRRRMTLYRNARTVNIVNLQPQATPANTSLNVHLPQSNYYAPGQGGAPTNNPGPYGQPQYQPQPHQPQPQYPPQPQYQPQAQPGMQFQPQPQFQNPSAPPPPYEEAKYFPEK